MVPVVFLDPVGLVGIDLGATNSVIATMDDRRVEVISNREGKLTTPSVVFFEGATLDDVLVGDSAVFRLRANPDRAVRSIKRKMGTDFKVLIDGQAFTPEQIASVILKKLKNDAQECFFGGQAVTDAVVTVPACFGPQEREATKRAVELAGLNVLALLPEPIAAAIDFAQTQGAQLADKTILVYDLGGGTFDVTVMRVEHQSGAAGPLAFRILGKDGSVQLGGADWDHALAEYVAAEFAAANGGKNPLDSPISCETLLGCCQSAKETLSVKEPEDTVEIVCSHDGIDFPVQISRQKFEELTRPLMNQTIDTSSQLVENLFGPQNPWSKIDIILLAGGSTKLPSVPMLLEKLSGIQPRTSERVDLNVGRGAAFLAFSPEAWSLDLAELDRRPETRGPASVVRPLGKTVDPDHLEAAREFAQAAGSADDVSHPFIDQAPRDAGTTIAAQEPLPPPKIQPQPVEDLGADSLPGSIRLHWRLPHEHCEHVLVTRSEEESPGPHDRPVTVQGLEWVDAHVEPGRRYYYTVFSVFQDSGPQAPRSIEAHARGRVATVQGHVQGKAVSLAWRLPPQRRVGAAVAGFGDDPGHGGYAGSAEAPARAETGRAGKGRRVPGRGCGGRANLFLCGRGSASGRHLLHQRLYLCLAGGGAPDAGAVSARGRRFGRGGRSRQDGQGRRRFGATRELAIQAAACEQVLGP